MIYESPGQLRLGLLFRKYCLFVKGYSMVSQQLAKLKPLLDPESQVEHLKNKGIKFEHITENEAKNYLETHNNYFKISSYRKNFEKIPTGSSDAGKYIGLDFAALKDLAKLDMTIRYVLIHLILDVEHFSKVQLLDILVRDGTDPYAIVDKFLLNNPRIRGDIEVKRNNIYCGGIVKKYTPDFPVWAFFEIISFGNFIQFYENYAKNHGSKKYLRDVFSLKTIKDLRNACAHNNCLIFDIISKNAVHKLNYDVSIFLGKNNISRDIKNKMIQNEFIRQFCTLLYIHKKFVKSTNIAKRASDELSKIYSRFYECPYLYQHNTKLLSRFDFLRRVIHIFCMKNS